MCGVLCARWACECVVSAVGGCVSRVCVMCVRACRRVCVCVCACSESVRSNVSGQLIQ